MNDNNRFLLNKQLNELETKEKRVILESKPLILMCILTRICNLRCIMCPRVRGEPLTLPFELIKKIYSVYPYLEKISWQGGEVFLLDYFKELFLKTADYPHISQTITTNGLLINKKWAKIFSNSNVGLDYSVDAVTKATYESIRCNAKFEDLLRSLDFVNEANTKYNGNIRLDLHAVVMRRNYRELFLFPDFCKRYNFRGLYFDLLWPDVIPQEDIFCKPDKAIMEYLNQEIQHIEDKCRAYNIYFRCTFKSYLEDFYHNCKDNNKKEGEEDIPAINDGKSQFSWDCLFAWKSLHVETDGYVFPECKCSRSIGYLGENSFEEIWNGEVMQLYRNLIKNDETDKICSEQCKFYHTLKRKESE